MQYDFNELHILNQLNDSSDISKRFKVPSDLRVMVTVTIIILLAALISGIYFKVDQIVPAQGVLETQQKLFEVRTSESGFVADINVEEGQIVKGGDVLVTIDPQEIELQISGIEIQQEKIARMVWRDFYQIVEHFDTTQYASLYPKIQNIPNPIDPFGYERLLKISLSNELLVFDKSLSEINLRQIRDHAQLELSRQSYSLSNAALQRQSSLYSKGVGNTIQYETAQLQNLEAKDRITLLEASINSIDAERNRLIAERTKFRDQFITERLVRIHENVDEYKRFEFEKQVFVRRHKELRLIAPFDGVIDKLNVLGRREIVESGKSVVSLRPIYGPTSMQIDMLVPSNYAIWVQEGMSFRASSLGNSPEDHGYIIGKIDYISKSTEEKNGSRLYRIRGEIEAFDYSDRVDPVEGESLLRPGLQLNVEIKVGKRRLINYVLDPFTDGFKRAMSEPS